jgi:spoIIIJ-associated protein
MHDTIETILKELLNAMGASYKGIEREDIAGQTIFSIKADDAREIIGPHGDTIYAIDTLVKKILERHMPETAEQGARLPHFLVDVNDYRARQIKDLQTKALMMAERARSFQYDVELTPMSAYERLIVHTTLQDAPHVKTESQGEGRGRRVVIKYSAE